MEIHQLLACQPIILFDGLCNLCHRAVQFIIKRDQQEIFHYTSLQSEAGQQLLAYYGLASQPMNTLILIHENQVLFKSDAAVEIAQRFHGGWKALSWVRWVPKVIRDWMYDLIADHRYRLFGKQQTCLMPSKESRSRFLSD